MTNLLNKGLRQPNEFAYYTEETLDADGQETLVFVGSPFQLHDDACLICE